MKLIGILFTLSLTFVSFTVVSASDCGSCQVMVNGRCVWCYELGQECRNDKCIDNVRSDSESAARLNKVVARISNIDDRAKIFVNGQEAVSGGWGKGRDGSSIGHKPGYTGEIDISGFFKMGDNEVRLWLWNEQVCCFVSADYEVSVDGQSLISQSVEREDSTSGVKLDKTYILGMDGRGNVSLK